MIANAGHEVAYHSVDGPSWERALDEDPDLVAIAGGDGTVGAVLTEMANREQALVTVLPLGSANNIARALGFPDRPTEKLVAGWATATRRRFRLGDLQAPIATKPSWRQSAAACSPQRSRKPSACKMTTTTRSTSASACFAG